MDDLANQYKDLSYGFRIHVGPPEGEVKVVVVWVEHQAVVKLGYITREGKFASSEEEEGLCHGVC